MRNRKRKSVKGRKRIVLGVGAAVLILAGILWFSGSRPGYSQGNAAAPKVGSSAPDFTLRSFQGQTYRLSGLKGKQVVLFFTEGVMCYPACWDQIKAFSSDARFRQKGIVVLAMTVDRAKDWEKAAKQDPEVVRGIPILLDTDKKVARAYRALDLPSSMHRGVSPGHTYILIDGKGVIRSMVDDPEMGVRNEEVLKELAKF
ncbi:MAG: redoxin domain-containing protein [Candidatus Tectomicrobia bacterium]|uniref:Redoxin domain-containing protein n=1 Tax=Tectimicrobiota bacterium TaxID=2528274 RepID=A0A932GRA6_UNCTE|nr:redoxin domain-containing protein [Candidatus Tectomicrobia bacterium]